MAVARSNSSRLRHVTGVGAPRGIRTSNRWTSVYDTLHQPSWQSSSQLGRAGLVDLAGAGHRSESSTTAADRTDLVYWLNPSRETRAISSLASSTSKAKLATQVYFLQSSLRSYFSQWTSLRMRR